MSKNPRHLITTADEATWEFDCPVIFLGEWCRNYERRHIWQEMDALVAEPYGLGKSKIDSDIAEAKVIEEEIFPILCQILNKYHDTNHSERFWKIIVGHWLREYIPTILNRTRTLQKCLNSYEISGITGYSPINYRLTVQRFDSSWFEAIESPQWNSALYIRLLEMISIEKQAIKTRLIFSEFENRSPIVEEIVSKQRSIKLYLRKFIKKLTLLFSRSTDAFIISSYLPLKEQVKLQIALGQCPSFWETSEVKLKTQSNATLREALTKELLIDDDKGLLKVIKTLLFEVFPVAYLEGFSEVQDITKEQKWPASPEFIFTSNAFFSSDVEKCWIATKAESGTTYIVGQHGNSYFTDRRYRNTIEEVTADKFLTWGWTDGTERSIPAFIFQNDSRKPIKVDPLGGLLLINTGPGISRASYDVSSLARDYIEMNQTFIKNLAPEPKNKTTLRLASATRHHPFSEKQRWQDFDSSLVLDEGQSPINKLISENRLIVHGYDSTGILLTLSQNIPTLAFWLNGFDHLNDDVVDDYNLLVSVGIIHLTPESAAIKVNEIWHHVESWWGQDEVLLARKQFCEKYAKLSQHRAKDLKKLLRAVSEK